MAVLLEAIPCRSIADSGALDNSKASGSFCVLELFSEEFAWERNMSLLFLYLSLIT